MLRNQGSLSANQRKNAVEYNLEMCSKYEKHYINEKPVVIIDEHNWVLPVWGTYANRLEQPMNLITFDTHTDTHAPFLRYLRSECDISSVPYDKKILKLPQIVELLKGNHYRINDFCFENVFCLADCIACDEQILTASVLGYLSSYVIIHKDNADLDDEQFGYDSKYIKHEEFAAGNRPEPRTPLVLDIDLDYFGNKKDILEWTKQAGKYLKAAEVITIAREPEWFDRCKTDSTFDAKQAEQELLKCIESDLDKAAILSKQCKR